MDNLILVDEVATLCKHIETFYKRYVKPPYLSGIKKRDRYLMKSFCFINDGNALGKYMIAAANQLVAKGMLESATAISVNGADNTYDCYEYPNIQFKSLDELLCSDPADKCGFFISVDCDAPQNKEIWFDAILKVSQYASKGKKNRMVVSALLPDYPAIPQGIESLAESEFGYYLEEYVENKTAEQIF